MRIVLSILFTLLITSVFSQELVPSEIFYNESDVVKARFTLYDVENKLKVGEFNRYHRDGSLNVTGWYVENKKDSIWKFYNRAGTKMAIGHFYEDLKSGQWSFYRSNGIIESTGNYKLDKKEGTWKYFNESGNLICEGEFKEGEEVEQSFTYLSAAGDTILTLEVISDPKIKPQCRTLADMLVSYDWTTHETCFSADSTTLNTAISKRILIPNHLFHDGISGKASILFFVKPNGGIEVIKHIGSFDRMYDKAVVKALKSLDPWIPATQNGNPVKVVYILPYSFKAAEDNYRFR